MLFCIVLIFTSAFSTAKFLLVFKEMHAVLSAEASASVLF